MKYDFERLIDRSEKGSSKWNLMKEKNSVIPDNIVP